MNSLHVEIISGQSVRLKKKIHNVTVTAGQLLKQRQCVMVDEESDFVNRLTEELSMN